MDPKVFGKFSVYLKHFLRCILSQDLYFKIHIHLTVNIEFFSIVTICIESPSIKYIFQYYLNGMQYNFYFYRNVIKHWLKYLVKTFFLLTLLKVLSPIKSFTDLMFFITSIIIFIAIKCRKRKIEKNLEFNRHTLWTKFAFKS